MPLIIIVIMMYRRMPIKSKGEQKYLLIFLLIKMPTEKEDFFLRQLIDDLVLGGGGAAWSGEEVCGISNTHSNSGSKHSRNGGVADEEAREGRVMVHRKDGTRKVPRQAIKGRRGVVLYVSRISGCGCGDFLKSLKELYIELHEISNFEVLFYSVDRDAATMNAYFTQDHGDWWAFPYDFCVENKEKLYMAGINECPDVVFIELCDWFGGGAAVRYRVISDVSALRAVLMPTANATPSKLSSPSSSPSRTLKYFHASPQRIVAGPPLCLLEKPSVEEENAKVKVVRIDAGRDTAWDDRAAWGRPPVLRIVIAATATLAVLLLLFFSCHH